MILRNCRACHISAGVSGFNTLFNKTGSNTGGNTSRDDTRQPVSLTEVSLAESLAASVRWRQTRPDSTLLRKLLEQQ